MSSYARAAIDAEIGALRAASSGRACATFRAAAAIGGLVGAGAISHEEAEALLLNAAVATGLPEHEALGHVRRGLRYGERTPRSLPTNCLNERSRRQPTHSPARAEQPPARPPKPEVEALWSVSVPVGSDPAVAAWFDRRFGSLASSFIDLTETWCLARAIPPDCFLPRWARSNGGSWIQTGHRVVVRLWNHSGQLSSLRARCVQPGTTPKSIAPAGFSVRGLVLADPLAVQLLSGAVPSWWEPREVVIAEGEPDWIVWAARQRDSKAQGPAVFGVEAGAWSERIATRIPDGARVVVRTHHDEPGERYAREIASSLRRRCEIFRSKSGEEGASQ